MTKYLLTVALFALSLSVFAQEKKETGIYFRAIAGTKINNFNKHFAIDLDPQLYFLLA